MSAGLGPLRRPIRIVLQWQMAATVVLALAGGFLAGFDGALSAACGGAVSVIAGAVSGVLATRSKARSAGEVLTGALGAELVKIGITLVLLLGVLAVYENVVAIAFLGTFVVTAVIFSMAFFVREHH